MDDRIKAYVCQPAPPPPLREADLARLAQRRRERLELALTGLACVLWLLAMAAVCAAVGRYAPQLARLLIGAMGCATLSSALVALACLALKDPVKGDFPCKSHPC
ncbi:MAG: hypothetical protein ACOYJA_10950 [Christensenellales bacterium]|jgi:hypothetical protein